MSGSAARASSAAVLALLLSGCILFDSDGQPAEPAAEPVFAGERLELLNLQHVDSRLQVLTLRTPALAAPTRVQILLPDRYDSTPAQRYPVVYLLQGAIDDYTAWIREGNAEALTAGYPMIIVMPDAGEKGFYSDWYNDGRYGTPQWETYHIRELIPWIDAHYRTVAARHGRAVGGVSMGGFGALSYAARHPDLFAAAVSFSGLVNSNTRPDRSTIPDAVFGPHDTQEVRWRGHNPWDLAGNLSGMDVTLYTRNGLPGNGYLGLDPAEIIVHQQNIELHQQLLADNVPHHWNDHGAGAHRWPTWQEDLSEALLGLQSVFAHPPAPPSPLSFTTIEPDYEVYGWHVALDRSALEFSTLANADAHGFTLSGSGGASVTTPPHYTPHAEYSVTLDNGSGPQRSTVRSSASGRLTIRLALGPANAGQQYSETARNAGGTKVYTATVAIAPGIARRTTEHQPAAP